MCGFVGCFREDRSAGPPSVALPVLLRTLRHRGPDGSGFHQGASAALGHVRLAILDVAGGGQPMGSDEGRRWIVHNGEIYNFRELGAALEGRPLRTRSDTEVILRLYEDFGPSCLTRLDGMYAFALLDGHDLFLARDPLGVKPLYICRREGWLYFASEIKALLPVSPNIQEFPPGHWYHSRQGLRRFFDLKGWTTPRAPHEEPVAAVREAMRESVRKRMVSDVPVGVFLSGGLDSSLVAALMRPHVEELHSFSVGMEGSEDLAFARRVSEHLGTIHHEKTFTEEEMRAVLPEVIRHLESFDFALVRSAIANFLVAELAARTLKVVLVGEGADEIFAGYHYLKGLSHQEYADELMRITAALHNSNLQRVDRMTMAHGIEGREPFLDLALLRVAFAIPPEVHRKDRMEKGVLRRAAEDLLPSEVVWRSKEKFSRGAGSAQVFERIAEREIGDAQFERGRVLPNGLQLRSKEEMWCYEVFRRFFPDSVAACLGWTAQPQAR